MREEQISDAQDLVTDKRSIKTNVLIDDGTILVLGGLIEDRLTKNYTKVPILGDIPLLGRAFRGSTETIRKQKCWCMLRPRRRTPQIIAKLWQMLIPLHMQTRHAPS